MRLTKKRQIQTKPTEYPASTVITTEAGTFYVVSPTKRYRFITQRVVDSWCPIKIVSASEADPAVKKMRIASKMKFRNGSLLYSQANGRMYLVSDNRLRHITNPDWLDWLGFSRSDAVWVSLDEINLHEEGTPLV